MQHALVRISNAYLFYNYPSDISRVSDPDPDSIRLVDPDPYSESGSRRAKMTRKVEN